MKTTIEKWGLLGLLLMTGLLFSSNSNDDHNNNSSPYQAVDLGLSVKWAACNVGATKPEDYGGYYAWGETRTKSEYTVENSVTDGKGFGDIGGDPQYDAARANWGGRWRLPTREEMRELAEECTWTWTTQGGRNGYKVTGKNGKSIFLPAAGWCSGSSLNDAGGYGGYWSSTSGESDTQDAYHLNFSSSPHSVIWYDRAYGRSVRPVSE